MSHQYVAFILIAQGGCWRSTHDVCIPGSRKEEGEKKKETTFLFFNFVIDHNNHIKKVLHYEYTSINYHKGNSPKSPHSSCGDRISPASQQSFLCPLPAFKASSSSPKINSSPISAIIGELFLFLYFHKWKHTEFILFYLDSFMQYYFLRTNPCSYKQLLSIQVL